MLVVQCIQSQCAPVLARFSFKWPEALDCSRLPDKVDDGSELCMGPPKDTDELDDAFGPYQHPSANNLQLRQLLNALRNSPNSSSWRHDVIGTPPASLRDSTVMTSRGSVCSQRYVMVDASSSSSSSCRPRCGVDVLYSSNDKRSVFHFFASGF